MSIDKMVDDQIREYLARLQHITDLYERARKATEQLPEDHHSKLELNALAEKKSGLEEKANEMQSLPRQNWQQEILKFAGPMAIWDIVAQQLENFVERHE